jgi:serine/threonine-protein kinase RsbW
MHMMILPRDDAISHVVLEGRLDTTGAEEINAEFFEATVGRGRPTLVDLSQVDFLASRGIGVLLLSGKRLLKAGLKMVLLSPQELVESVLDTSRTASVLPIAHDLEEAIRILHGAQPAMPTAAARLEPFDEAEPQRSEAAPGAPAVWPGELKLAIKNELAELKHLSATLAQFLEIHGVPHRPAYAVNLAIDELVVNVINYAYVDDDTHLIDIQLVIEGEQIILRIEDDGRPFDPRRGPALDVHAEDRETGGLGLVLVLDMVDVLKYRRVEPKNLVEVRVHLFPEDRMEER